MNTNCGLLVSRCSVEIAQKICGYLTVQDIVLYASTARQNYIAFHDYLGTKRLRDTIGPFVPNVPRFLSALRTHSSVVSGSVALHFFDPAGNWVPEDMDIYVPSERKKKMLRFLETIGYYVVERGRIVPPAYQGGCGFYSVTTVCNGSKNIDVITAIGKASIAPIFRFHLSAVMNFLSADSFFCAYPTLTTEKKAIYNKSSFVNGEPSPSTVQAYIKYAERGYTLRRSPTEFGGDIEGHRCRRSLLCPLTVRNNFDAGCMIVSLRGGLNQVIHTQSDRVVCKQAAWQLGDTHCKTGDKYGSTHAFAYVKD
ncbi:hypothetical protein BJ138DRAFT_1120097 [Hygrophoropsis aurantiaca]|uniref:Uncharacterized protein n=1 Tax=Hygrophoropsis aurantiaca TaxID=72124 RepID=A0ACB7ZSA8_9AGAM|nr:hypothetical protein BJ138DRAFT_1120097 [Hygrophoropsis aurantiaca]